jgi:hypothetical protein
VVAAVVEEDMAAINARKSGDQENDDEEKKFSFSQSESSLSSRSSNNPREEGETEVTKWLQRIGLSTRNIIRFSELFTNEEFFKINDVKFLTDNSLKELGIKMAPRLKLIDAIGEL